MPLEGPLLDILACPIDKLGLLYFADEAVLYNPRLRRLYRIVDGSPVMLADRAEPAAEDEHLRLLKRATHGEAIGTAGLLAAGLGIEDDELPSRVTSAASPVPGVGQPGPCAGVLRPDTRICRPRH